METSREHEDQEQKNKNSVDDSTGEECSVPVVVQETGSSGSSTKPLSRNGENSSRESESYDNVNVTNNTTTNNDNSNINNVINKSESSIDALANGLSTLLTTVIKDFDARAQDTLKSQDHLNSALDRLTGELDRLLEDAPLPFIIQHAPKISVVRKRVSSLNSVLKSIQQRIDNIDRLLTVGLVQEKAAV